MGCSGSIQNTNESIQIKQPIIQKIQQTFHFHSDILDYIIKEASFHFLNDTEEDWLLNFINEYLMFYSLYQPNEKQWNQDEFLRTQKTIKQLGEDSLKNLNQIHFRHYKAVIVLEKLFHSKMENKKINMNQLKYNLKDLDQILLVSNIVKQCCEEDMNCFYFLSVYLDQCCKKMGLSKQCEITEIEAQLKKVLNFLRERHPPNENKPSGKTTVNVEGAVDKLDNTLKLNLSQIQTNKRNQKLEEFILYVANLAEQSLGQLKRLTKEVCNKNQGTQYKAGLKVKNKQSKNSIDRVKEKLLSEEFKKLQIPQKITDLEQFRKSEMEHYHKQMEKIFSSINKQITFSVSDMVRGKVMFDNIEKIKDAAEGIIEKIKQKGYKFEVDNRLGGRTTDFVFKIKIGQVIAQFQLAYKFNVVKNQFNHKLYELARSKFFTILSTNFVFNENSIHFFNGVFNRIKKVENSKKQIRKKMKEKEQLESAKQLKKRYDLFMKNINKSQIEESFSEETKDKKNKFIQKIKQRLKTIKTKQSLSKTGEIRKQYFEGIFWKENLKYDKALQEFGKMEIKLEKQKDTQKSYELKIMNQKLSLNSGSVYYYKGNYDQALKYYRKSLKIQQQIKGQNDIECSLIINDIGIIYKDQGNYEQALKYFHKCLKIQQQIKGLDSIDCTGALNNIGMVFYNKGNYQQSLKFYHKCLKIQQQIKGQNSLDCALTLNNIGNIYKDKANYDQAIKYYRKSLKIQQQIKGQNSIYSALTFKNIGLVNYHIGNFVQALKYYQKSLKIQQQIKGQNDIDCTGILNNIGSVYKDMGSDEQALKYYHKCLKIQQQIKGQYSIDCTGTLNNIGIVYYNKGNYDQALKYYHKSLKIKQQIQGQNSIDCALTLNNIGIIYKDKGNYKQALKYYHKCLKIQQQIKSQNSIDCTGTFHNIGIVYYNEENYDQALKYYHKSLKIKQQIKGQNSIDCAITLNGIGMVYYNKGNYEQALKYFHKCLKIQQEIKGQTSIDCVLILNNIGNVYKNKANYDWALEYYHKSLKIEQYVKGQNSIDCTGMLNNIGNIYKDKANYDLALKYYHKCLKIEQQIKGQNSVDCASTLANIGIVYFHLGDKVETLKYLQKSLKIFETVYGKSSPQYLKVLQIIQSCK